MSGATSRRGVLRATATGAVGLAFTQGAPSLAEAPEIRGRFDAHLWLQLDADGAIRFFSKRVEMGQGAHTGLRAIAAEELRVAPQAITVVQASSDVKFGQILTGGSMTVAGFWERVRNAAATARIQLVRAAAQVWNVPAAECEAAAGAVMHRASGRRIAYRKLVTRAAALPPLPEKDIVLTPAAQFRVVGRPGPACHHEAIVTGTARYGIDQPGVGLLHATILRSPALGGRVARVDDSAARGLPGYRGFHVIAGNAWPSLDHVRAGIAVLADSDGAALRAREKIRVEWDLSAARTHSSDAVIADLRRQLDRPGVPVRSSGQSRPPESELTRADYTMPYLCHAQLEPLNAVARVEGDRIEVWTGTQRQRRLHDAIVRELGFAQDKVVVHTGLIGGGFGRRLEVDYGLEAAMLAVALKRPVKTLWTRGDDFLAGLFRPASAHRLEAKLENGRIAWFGHRVVSESVWRQQEPGEIGKDGGDGAIASPLKLWHYDVGGVVLDHHPYEPTHACAWWRGTGPTQSGVAAECFMDELAHRAGRDPLDFRLDHMPAGVVRRVPLIAEDGADYTSDRMRRVLTDATDRAGWRAARAAGRAMGLACGYYDCLETYTAAVAEAAGPPDDPRIVRITIVTDCGLVVTPRMAEAQVMSNAIFGMAAALWQEIRIEGGVVQAQTYNDHRVVRMADTPEIDIAFVPSDRAPSGLGEPGTPIVMAAVANAVAALRGRPTRDFPVAQRRA